MAVPKQSLIRRIVGLPAPPPDEERSTTGIFPFSWEALAQQLTFAFNGISYPYGYGASTTYGQKQEPPEATFEGYVQFAYRTNGVVFACMVARMLLFAEARFQFRRLRNGRPGDLFGNEDLAILEKPWPNGTTGDLLARAMQDADLAGNFYARRGRRGTLKRMRPDWVDIILGSDFMPDEPAFADDVEIAGYAYWPGGRGRADKPVLMLPEEVCHFAPIPDPCAHFRGMSWLTPVVREIMADSAATDHKQTYFENGATPNLLVKGDPQATPANFQEFVDIFKHEHGDLASAFRFMFLGGGADATVIGNDMKQMDFKVTQGAGETRICMAARVPPIIVGSAEGLESATYSNYGMARRAFADLTMRPLWRQVAGALAQVVDVPSDAELWYDDRDIPFLQEDVKDAADIVASQAQAIRTLTDGGYRAESVVPAVVANDLRLLEHSGMLPVQVRPPGEGTANGNGAAAPPGIAAGRAFDETKHPREPKGVSVGGQFSNKHGPWVDSHGNPTDGKITPKDPKLPPFVDISLLHTETPLGRVGFSTRGDVGSDNEYHERVFAVRDSDQETVGYLDIVHTSDQIAIEHVEVPEQYRRNGIATTLLDAVKVANPQKKVVVFGGFATKEGAAFLESVTKGSKNGQKQLPIGAGG